MKKIFKKSMSAFLALMMVASCVALPGTAAFAKVKEKTAPISSNAQYVKGEAIAVLDGGITDKEMKSATATFGKYLTVANTYDFSGGSAYTQSSQNEIDDVKIATFKSSTLDTEQIMKKLAKNQRVKYVFPNYIMKASDITDDTYSKYQWALDNKGQNGGTAGLDINPEYLWDAAAKSDKEQIVAVLDTGIDYTNEDLQDSLWVNPYGSKLMGKYGYDFTGTNDDMSPLDNNGHGTHVAGIIAGTADNQKGISGVNKSNVKIMAVKWLDDEGRGETDDVIAAYDYVYRAMKLGANVVAINNSWGGSGDLSEKTVFEELFNKLGKMGAVSFIAAGNESVNVSDTITDLFSDEASYNIPAVCESDYAVVVGASNENDALTSFSNYSKDCVDIAAPGANILSTVSYNCFNPTIYTAEQRNAVCSSYQDYEDNLSSGEFGSYTVSSYNDTWQEISTDAKAELDTKYFGAETSGKSLKFTTSDTNGDASYYAMEIPYTLDDETQNYSYSFMISATGNVRISVLNIPAKYSVKNAIDDAFSELEYSSTGTDYWDHLYSNVDVALETKEFSYKADKDRKLIFVFEPMEGNEEISVNIDDLAVSKQGVDSKEFGKYDFYNGTSMATPYAVGAYALIKNAYTDSSTLEAVNILKNTGRHSDALVGYTENARVLSLDKTTELPPMVLSAAYNKNGNLAINGSFTSDTAITINGTAVEPLSYTKNRIIIADNNYSTKKITISASNQYGSTEKTVLVANKSKLTKKNNMTVPEFDGSAYFLPVGSQTWVVTQNGDIGYVIPDPSNSNLASFATEMQQIDLTALFDELGEFNTVDAAAYLNGKIYFIASNYSITSSGVSIGSDVSFGYYDLDSDETVLVTELPYSGDNSLSSLEGYSLVTYNGAIYLMGGYDYVKSAFSNKVYKFDSSKSQFVDTGKNLPESRAYGKAIQYGSKLVYAYGTDGTDQMPAFMVFDGKNWTKSSVALDSDDFDLVYFSDRKEVKVFNGDVSIGNGNVICMGSYIYGYGDIYSYDADSDKLVEFSKCLSNSTGVAKNAYMTTVNGLLVAYVVGGDEEMPEITGYQTSLKTDYAQINTGTNKYADLYADTSLAMYGDIVNITAVPNSGYAINYISVNGKKYSAKGKAGKFTFSVTVNSSEMNIKVSAKRVAPANVTSVKALSVTSSSVTLSWGKSKNAEGYVIQEYVNNGWKTVKTIKSASTTSAKLTVKPGAHKYRVRAYSVYSNTKQYSSGASVNVYIPTQQSIKSLTAAAKGFTVKFAKDTKATGYQIQYSTSSKFNGATTKTLTSNKTASYTAKSLSKGKKYYVRVRSYKVVNGKKVYGKWSAYKSVTTK